jgi:hypothetical protein
MVGVDMVAFVWFKVLLELESWIDGGMQRGRYAALNA